MNGNPWMMGFCQSPSCSHPRRDVCFAAVQLFLSVFHGSQLVGQTQRARKVSMVGRLGDKGPRFWLIRA